MRQYEKAVFCGATGPSLIESLEERRMLAVTLGTNGTLSVSETVGDVSVLFTRTNVNLDVVVNGARVGSFPLTNILKIVVTTGNGNDSIIVAPTSRDMFVNMEVYSRGGDDQVITAAGNDKIVGGGGADSLMGGDGDDRFWGDYETLTEASLDPNYPMLYADEMLGENGFDRVFDLGLLDTWTPGSQTSGGNGSVGTGNYVQPSFTLIGGDGLDPNVVRQWYNFGTLGNSGVLTGSGQTIYLVTPFAAPNLALDLQTFSKAYGIPFSSANLQIVNVGGGAASEPTWGAVTAAQVQWMHAMAPGAKLVVVQAQSDLSTDVSAAIRKAASLSEAAGGGVVYFGFTSDRTGVASDIPGVIKKAARTTFIAPTGDTPNTVSYLATLSTVLAVGGSAAVTDDTNALLGETALDSSGAGRAGANSAPYWQRQLGYTRRVSPDVVYHADVNNPYAFYTSSPIFNATDSSFSSGWTAGASTTLAGAQWAALFAIINQKRVSAGLAKIGGAAAAALYTANKASGFGALNDITTGTAGTATAKAGFDLATGLGSPDAQQLVKALSSVQPFYLSGTFKWSGKFYKRPTSPTLGEFERDPLVGEPRGGTGTLSGGDRIDLTMKAEPNKWAPSFVARTDTFQIDPGGLYRTANGRVYGYGTATIHDEDMLALTNPDAPWAAPVFRIRFEGTITRVDATHERISLKFFAVNPTTNTAIPESPFSRQRQVDLGTAPYDGTWFGGSMTATVFSLSSKYTLPASGATIVGIDPDDYENDNKATTAKAISIEGTPQRHTMHSQTDVDWVTFELAESSRVIIETNGVSGGDTVLSLYNENLRLLRTNDDAGIQAYSRIDTTLQAGRYYVKVSQFAKYSKGISDYSITVRGGTPLPSSPIRLAGTALTVTGTEDQDEIILTHSGADLLIDVNGAAYYVPASLVKTITVNGLGSDDTINLSTFARATVVYGGDGSDTIMGGSAADEVYGGLGMDIINGLAGDDVIFGEEDDDQIIGGLGDDVIVGGFGNDTMDGSEGADVLDGEEGNDSILGGAGMDYLTGGFGADSMNALDGEQDTINADGADPIPLYDDVPGVLTDMIVTL